MDFKLKSFDLNVFAEKLASGLKVQLVDACQEQFMELTEQHGEGILRAFDFEDGVQALLIEAKPKEPWRWQFRSAMPSPVLLCFVVRGSVTVSHDGNGHPIQLRPLSTLFASVPANGDFVVVIGAGNPLLMLQLQIKREDYIDHVHCFSTRTANKYSEIFQKQAVFRLFQNLGEYGVKSSSLLAKILTDDREGLVRATFAEAKLLEVFSLQLDRWGENFEEPKVKVNLLAEDLERLSAAKKIILDNLGDAPTIEELAKLVGLNRQKLKQGFKKVNGKTINNFLRDERLKLARKLLATGQRLVGEVAFKVGYQSASYFARRFQEKYGITPSEYLRSLYNDNSLAVEN